MKRTIALCSLLGLFFVSTGCKGGAAEMVSAAEEYEKATCACKDAACTAKAAEDYAKKTKDLAGKDLKPSEDDTKKITAAATKAGECMTKAMGAPAPTP